MNFQSDRNYLWVAWICIAGATAFRLVYAPHFLLTPDETNYWQWSRYLDWGYHDQAPLIAWAIKLFTLLLGHTELAVRLPSILAMAVTSFYLVAIARRWFSAKTALSVAILSQGIFEFNVGGLLATADGIQAAGWAGAAYHVARAYEQNAWRQWLWGGFWFGFGILSKYTMVLFLPSVYLYGLVSTTHRQRLFSIRPYAGVLLGCFMFLPVICWNASHGWNSARHVAYIGGASESFQLHIKYIGDLFAAQAGLLSPVVFVLVLMAWYRIIRKKYDPQQWILRYLFYASFPMFAFFTILSLHSRVYGNWPAAAYVTAAVLAAAFYQGKKVWSWAIGTAYLFTGLVLLQVVFPVLPLTVELDRTAVELSGWDKIGQTVDQVRLEMPRPDETFMFGLRYQIASELAFYAPGNPKTVSINRWRRPNVYDYWWRDEDLIGMDGVGVALRKETVQSQLREVFEKVDPPIPVTITRTRPLTGGVPETVKTVYVFRAYGFKGGIHWQPPDLQDIRVSDSY